MLEIAGLLDIPMHIQQSLVMFILGFVGWFATGIDDWLIFSSIYSHYHKNHKAKFVVLGFCSAVTLMIMVVLSLGIVSTSLQKWAFLGGIVPLFLGVKTLVSSFKNTKSEIMVSCTSGAFISAFLGFILNCTDDIVYNSAMILAKTNLQLLSYIGGVVFGSVFMVLSVVFLNKKIKDHPIVRGSILILVSLYLFLSGLKLI